MANVSKDDESEDEEVYSALVVAEQLANSWILDSGCSYHMCPHVDWFESYNSALRTVSMGNNAPCKAVSMGSVKIQMFDGVASDVANPKKQRRQKLGRGRE